MLMNLHKKRWMEGLSLTPFNEHTKNNEKVVEDMLRLAKDYNDAVNAERIEKDWKKLEIQNVGKIDPKRHLEMNVEQLMSRNIVQILGAMLDTVVF